MIGVLVGSIDALGSTERSDLAGEGPFSGGIVSEPSTLLAPSESSPLSTNLSALSDMFTDVTTTLAVGNVFSAATPPSKGAWTDTWGATLGLMAILSASVAKGINSVGAAVVSLLLDVDSLLVDGIGLTYGANLEDWVVLGMDGATVLIDYVVVAPYAGLEDPW